MLFTRLAEAKVELPDYPTQRKFSRALLEVTSMNAAIAAQLYDLQQLPHRIIAESLEGSR
jgi:hypothetical protein